MGRKKKTEETDNDVFTSGKNLVELCADNYTTIEKLDKALADVEKQIKNVDKKHNKKTKEVEENCNKHFSYFDAQLLNLKTISDNNSSKLQSNIDELQNKLQNYIQYQEDTEKINDFCKKTKIKYNGIESYRLVLNKLYELALKDRIQELKSMLKSVKANDYRSYYTLDQTKKCISELDRYEDRQYYNSRLERLERIKKYKEELQWKIK